MYGSKQAAILAFDNLIKYLSSHGYMPVPNIIEIWQHFTQRPKFFYVLMDFDVKYYTKDDAKHLIN